MKTTIKASKLTSFVKHTIFVLAAFFTSTVFADYYIGSAYSGCSTPCCGSPCSRMGYETRAVQRIYVPPVKKVKYYRRTRSLGGYNMVVYYVWPSYTGVVYAPACGSGCMQPVCSAPSCAPDFYVPPEYYTSVSNVDQYIDQTTGDDFRY